MAYRTVVVGTDGSPSSFRAVSAAASLAAATGATLVLACAYLPMRERDRSAAADLLGELSYKVSGSTPAEDALRAAREHAVAAGAPAIELAAEEGDPVDVLVSLAGRLRADLLVVGNRGLNSLTGRLLGSVPSSVSQRAECDVLIVRTTSGR
ncbi:universal stress protein [Planomonospora parontospora subsp. parontospora]|uniref:Universal stress protein n=2 Tax=Planomonospora parontospora TaxID=58119 RepID=A0AA37BGS0_9ACTN|nr:universal stress protein [Planomonospora parontospora]GGK66761.1 universal stress protein [Planomonospora parontospora]GII08536.1 universal stress protein [Planomonospora parontospora subsp. parontospora]